MEDWLKCQISPPCYISSKPNQILIVYEYGSLQVCINIGYAYKTNIGYACKTNIGYAYKTNIGYARKTNIVQTLQSKKCFLLING